jgi:CheY-like chemotaxis protein
VANFHYRILIADDDEQIRRSSEAMLSRAGYEIRTAGDGFEGLALMRKALPDLVISDLNMPRMSGFEFLSVVRRRFPQIPVIVISATFTGSQPQGLLADAFFHKGEYSREELLKEIESLLEKSPIRLQLPKPENAPVWIPRNGSYIVLTCPECLRSFSLSEDEVENGLRELPCMYCSAQIRFTLEPGPKTKV